MLPPTPNDSITYQASNRILSVHSNASYLIKYKAHSCIGTHIFLSEDDPVPKLNRAVMIIAQIIKSVMSSAAEA